MAVLTNIACTGACEGAGGTRWPKRAGTNTLRYFILSECCQSSQALVSNVVLAIGDWEKGGRCYDF